MRIETTSIDKLRQIFKSSRNSELKEWRFRFLGIFDRHLCRNDKPEVEVSHLGEKFTLVRKDFYEKYNELRDEMKRRDWATYCDTRLEKEIFKFMLKQAKKRLICKFCDKSARWAYIYNDGNDFVAVCHNHRAKAREELKKRDADVIVKHISEIEDVEKTESFDIKKPYPNEHACRLHDPGKYTRFVRMERRHDGKKYSAIIGFKKGGGSEDQAYRYPKNTWVESQARNHCKEHDGIKFEPALETKQAKYNCECIECGHKMTSDKHCIDLKCPKCGGGMRRSSRPGPGQKFKFEFKKVDEEQKIVGGVIYEPDVKDTQGDQATSKEIEKAMYKFMEDYSDDTKRINVMHAGKRYHFPVIETFIPEQDIKKGGYNLKAGTWWMMVKITNPEIWKMIKSGELNAFSMEGKASEELD